MTGRRPLLVLLGFFAWLGLTATVTLGCWLLAKMAARCVAEPMQATGGLEPTAFARIFYATLLVEITLILACVRRARTGRSAHPWWPLLGAALFSLAAFSLLFGLWLSGEEPPGVLLALTGLLCLGLVALVLPIFLAATAARWVKEKVLRGWSTSGLPLTTFLLLALCLGAPLALWAGASSLAQEDGGSEVPAWVTADDMSDRLRLLLAELAYAHVSPGRPERPISGMSPRPDVHYSASPAAQRRNELDPKWRCHLALAEQPDPSDPHGRPVKLGCAERLRRAGHPDPENEAAELVVKVCLKQPDDPLLYYSRACTYRRTDLFRRSGREVPWDEDLAPDAPVDRQALRHCLRLAQQLLDEREREALMLYAQGADAVEVAEHLEVSRENARQIVSRGSRKLRASCGYLR